MRLEQSPLPGVWVIELEPIPDERGWFARSFDADEFAARGLDTNIAQCNASFTQRRGTLRGMHYQAEPHGESKLVRCVRGAAFHVALDLRRSSPTYCCWHGAVLSAQNLRALYLPAGFAHGSQTLVDDCALLYQMSHRYVPEAARGVRWDDPAFAIEWPPVAGGSTRLLSERDSSFPNWRIEAAQSRA
jgi:dTDP-4-dehydrorhamnose 3,5-epimerase